MCRPTVEAIRRTLEAGGAANASSLTAIPLAQHALPTPPAQAVDGELFRVHRIIAS
jgi:hypothetical protein